MRTALPERATCRLCGRSFGHYAGTRTAHCKRCAAKAEREIARVIRTKCKECGKAISTTKRTVRYCSDPCRDASYARIRNAPRRDSQKPPPSSSRGPVKCRACGKKFTPERKPGTRRVYCSDECRTANKRRLYREYMRKYLSDPEKHALQVARSRACAARRREEDRKERLWREQHSQ